MCIPAQKTCVIVASVHPLYDTRIAKHLALLLSEGYDVVYLNWSKSPTGLPAGLDSVRLVHCAADASLGLNVVRFAMMLAWFLRQAIRLQPRLVHLHDVVLLPLVPALKVLTSARVVFDAHEHYCRFPGMMGMFSRWSYRLLLPLVDGIVAVSPSTLPASRHPSAVVANYQRRSDFEPHRSNRGANGDVKMVYFGSLSPDNRDVGLLLNIAEALLAHLNHVSVQYGGRLQGPGAAAFRPGFERLCRQYPERFHWFEEMPRQEVLRETATADVGLWLMLPNDNLRGGSPNKIFEYLAVGAAIVATDGFALADDVAEARAGLLVPAGVPAVDLVPRLLDLLGDRPRLDRMKQASWELGNRYRWETAEDGYRQVYRQMGVCG